MLQELVKAYGDAYTVAITPSITRRNETAERNHESQRETPVKTSRGRSWRALLSAFL